MNALHNYDQTSSALAAAMKLPSDPIFPAPKMGESKAAKVAAAKAAFLAAATQLESLLEWRDTGDRAEASSSMAELAAQYDSYWTGASDMRAYGMRIFKRCIRIEADNGVHIDADPSRNDPHAWAGHSSKDTASRNALVQLASVKA